MHSLKVNMHKKEDRKFIRSKHLNTVEGFDEFPYHMSTPQLTTPQVSNKRSEPQSRIRFADDTTIRSTRMETPKQVLFLGSINDTPTSTSPVHANSLDFSMIATPGGAKFARVIDHDGATQMAGKSESSVTSSGTWTTDTPFTNLFRGFVSSASNINQKKIQSSTPYTAARQSLLRHDNEQPVDCNGSDKEYTALIFARSAPISGYLRKLGKNIPTMKRRFFVLKPSTHLYYFMSPNDIEPRGCIDLDLVSDNEERGGCEVREIGLLPDGAFQFELLFDSEVNDKSRSKDITLAQTEPPQTSIGNQKREFERKSIILEARTERIGRDWMEKLQSERLSTARGEIDVLKTALAEMKTKTSQWERAAIEKERKADEAETKRDEAVSEAKSWKRKFDYLNDAIGLLVQNSRANNKPVDLDGRLNLDSLKLSIKESDLNDSNFHDVLEEFQKINDNYIHSSKNVQETRECLEQKQKQLEEANSHLASAEARLCDAWESNCALQKELKRIRREKKILVKEVRSLHANVADHSHGAQMEEHSSTSTKQNIIRMQNSTKSQIPINYENSRAAAEQQKLVIELEEHVMSGLRLSEQFLTLNGIEASVAGDDIDSCMQRSQTSQEWEYSRRSQVRQDAAVQLMQLSSLLDDDSTMIHDEESTMEDNQSLLENSEVIVDSKNCRPSNKISGSDNDVQSLNTHNTVELIQTPDDQNINNKKLKKDQVNRNLNRRFRKACSEERTVDSHHRTQPLSLKEQYSMDNAPPPIDIESSYSESSRSKVTETGHATINLKCPLKDVGEPTHASHANDAIGDDGEIYHITFHSSKVGLQFQKVPMENSSVSLLKEAMTADNGSVTALDTKRTEEISLHTSSKGHQSISATECLPIAPIDMILVCGFVGFDDSNGNIRPRLGARLVAFDGIPVEVGKWTFESIRNSIKARGRPLTLSFRNDFLTPKQRAILTKAINDVNACDLPKENAIGIFRGTSNTTMDGDENSTISKTCSVSSYSHKYYSFSEAGSSISSTVVPLMSTLMMGLSGKQRQEELTPQYLKRQSDCLNDMGHYHEYKSGLL